eukprot:TRINITY_DN7224_c0_g1_i1.p1 TRINITY_DN7224_c0_g1~~TRINITY_DN7224_c0_g1_i1.p1  ORF type:complete len:159 (-),score=10.32 TRINITY_DN7224_c0_g1_i1:64-477(-)
MRQIPIAEASHKIKENFPNLRKSSRTREQQNPRVGVRSKSRDDGKIEKNHCDEFTKEIWKYVSSGKYQGYNVSRDGVASFCRRLVNDPYLNGYLSMLEIINIINHKPTSFDELHGIVFNWTESMHIYRVIIFLVLSR